MHTPPLFNNVAWSIVSNATLLQKSPKLPDQTGLLKNSITIELPFIQFHLTLLNRPYGCESAGGKTPDTGQAATTKFLHLWSIEECVTWVCVYVCARADTGIHAYAALCWCLLSCRSPDGEGLEECVIAASIGKMSAPSPGFVLCGSGSVAGLPPSFRSHLQLSSCIKPAFKKYKYWNDTHSSSCVSYRMEKALPIEPINNPQQSMRASQPECYIKWKRSLWSIFGF